MNVLPEQIRKPIQIENLQRIETGVNPGAVGRFFIPGQVNYVPPMETEGETYEDHVKHLNWENRFLYG